MTVVYCWDGDIIVCGEYDSEWEASSRQIEPG